VGLSSNKLGCGQPLQIGVPGAGFDRRQAARAWEIAVRLREQSARFRVECDIGEPSLSQGRRWRGLNKESGRQQGGFQ
jgi:hypothetical protein